MGSQSAADGRLERFVRRLIDDGLYTAVVVQVSSAREVLWQGSAGEVDGLAGVDTLFDLASLTKPITATLALVLDRQGRLPLGLEVGEAARQLGLEADPRLARRTLRDLLRHRAGFEPWAPLYELCRGRGEVLGQLLGSAHLGRRRDTYSDLGPILWKLLAERLLGEEIAACLRREVLVPLGLGSVTPSPVRPAAGRVARCRVDGAREAELAAVHGLEIVSLPSPRRGQVQDGNARFLGGWAGHAGLFAAAGDLLRLALEWSGPGRLLAADAVEEALGGKGIQRLGWRRRTLAGGSGAALSDRAFGHFGFTGGSLWIDPDAESGTGRIVVCVGHRASATSSLTAARRALHRLAMTPRAR